jgi:hypothetical protein
MTTIYIDLEGNVQGLADDIIDKLNLGLKKVERVSNVEYDHGKSEWVAEDLLGNVIASDPIRSRVIELERIYFNSTIEAGFSS